MCEGSYHALRSEWFAIGEHLLSREYQLAILASTAQMVIWPLVPSFVLGHVGIDIRNVGDGGLIRTTPLMDVVEEREVQAGDEVWVLMNSNPWIPRASVPTSRIIPRLARTLDIALTDKNRIEVEHSAMILKTYGVSVVIVSPLMDLGDGLQFAPQFHMLRYGHGYEVCLQMIENPRERMERPTQ